MLDSSITPLSVHSESGVRQSQEVSVGITSDRECTRVQRFASFHATVQGGSAESQSYLCFVGPCGLMYYRPASAPESVSLIYKIQFSHGPCTSTVSIDFPWETRVEGVDTTTRPDWYPNPVLRENCIVGGTLDKLGFCSTTSWH
jgi:hypothetical protein